jgi:hypothetical protein
MEGGIDGSVPREILLNPATGAVIDRVGCRTL